jgi:hypothetical protein
MRSAEQYFPAAIEAIWKNLRNYTKKKPVDFRESNPIGF